MDTSAPPFDQSNRSQLSDLPAPEYLNNGRYPVHIDHGNSYIVRDIERFRVVGDETMMALRKFQLGVRALYLYAVGLRYGQKTCVSEAGRAHVENRYITEYDLNPGIPEWLVLDRYNRRNDGVVDNIDDFEDVVAEALERTVAIDEDPVERWPSIQVESPVDGRQQVRHYATRLGDEIAIGEVDGARVLALRVGVAKMQTWNGQSGFGDVYLSAECADTIESIYRDWKLYIEFPNEVVYAGKGPEPERILTDSDEFFGLVRAECERATEVVEPVAIK